MEATSASNDNLLGAQDSVAGARQNIKLRLAEPFLSSVAPTNLPNFSSSEGGSWRDSICLAKACAAAFSLVLP